MIKFECTKVTNPMASKWSKFAIVRFTTGERWLVGNIWGWTINLRWDTILDNEKISVFLIIGIGTVLIAFLIVEKSYGF